MSTSAQSTTPTEQAPERTLAQKIISLDYEFRHYVKVRVEELTRQAGAAALEFLLHPEKMESKQMALSAKSRCDALSNGLSRYVSACRNYHDVPGALNTVRGIVESLETLGSFHREEAEMAALKNLTGSESETADGRQRQVALDSYHRAEGTKEFVETLQKMFASVLQDGNNAVNPN